MKATKVELLRTDTNHTEEFEITHAEALLRMPNNGGWVLPEKSKFQFDLENGITRKRDKE